MEHQILIPADDFHPEEEEEKQSPVVIDDQYSCAESDSDSDNDSYSKFESKAAPVPAVTPNARFAAAAAANSPGNAGSTQPRVSLTSVVVALTRFLSPREMKIMIRIFQEFRGKKIGVDELKRKVRLIAGDKLISAVKMAAGASRVVGVNKARSAPVRGGGLRIENASVRDIYLPGLITVLAEFLPAGKIEMLRKSFGDFKDRKINRGELASSVRQIVGDANVSIAGDLLL